jgi:ankyrin repeat protein/nucleoside phosphorylase
MYATNTCSHSTIILSIPKPANSRGGSDSLKRPRLSHADYTVACVCPLAVELAPPRAMLDSIHEDLPAHRNHNAYVLGELGKHNIVIVVLSGIGNNHSGIAATQVLNDFPSIRFVLLVGIGGGVPSPGVQDTNSVRLGDIVVGQPTDTTGGVIQFDRGKRLDGDYFERTGCLDKPQAFLTATVEKLKAKHWQEGNKITEFIADMTTRNQNMETLYTFPGPEQDQLFESDYHHESGETCQHCDLRRTRHRQERPDSSVKVHYGIIGSSNSVVKSAVERDSLRERYNILCVEMEAAGLMDAFSSCLVIRGICDYSDSHKNKQWQPFAAAAAAAYAKEFLLTIPALQQSTVHIPLRTSPGHYSESSLVTNNNEMPLDQSQTRSSVEAATYNTLLDSLPFERMNSRLLNIARALSQTCQWIFEDETFKTWITRGKLDNHHGFLWIKGKPGSGKSTIMVELMNTLKKTQSGNVILSYFFNARAPNYLEKSSIGMYRSLVHQLLRACPHVHAHFTELFASKAQGSIVDEWSPVELQGFLTDVIDSLGDCPVDILIDALDEGDENDVREMVAFLEDLCSRAVTHGTSLRICLSSRHYPHISIRRGLHLILEHQDGQREDIDFYIRLKLVDDGQGKMEPLRQKLRQKSSFVFLWVVLVIPMLNKLHDRGQLTAMEKCLEDIPDTLDGLFDKILARNSEDIDASVMLLQWILFAMRPLSPTELYLAIQSGLAPSSTQEESIPSDESLKLYLLNCSRGLTEVTKSNPPVIQFIHESVRDFLIRDNGLAKINPTLSCNFDGLCHEQLSKACLRYFDQCLPPHQNYQRRAVPVCKEKAATVRKRFPFSDYVIAYMFSHANIAEGSGIRHRLLLSRFQDNISADLLKWVQYRNTFERFQVRRYTAEVQLLYILSENDLLHLARLLLEAKVDVNLVGQRYGNAYQAACVKGHVEMAKLLLENGTDITAEGGEYEHALFAAIHKTHEPIIQSLLRPGLSLSDDTLTQGLFLAIDRRNWHALEILLKGGASPNCVNPSAETPLCLVVYADEFEAANLLLQNGADVNAYSPSHANALQAAIDCESVQMVQLLIENGADVNAHNDIRGSALQAAIAQDSVQMVQLLIEDGADVNAHDGFYGNALQTAVARDQRLIVQLLIEKGADVNAQGGWHGSALQAAARHGYTHLLRLLIEKGANVNTHGGYDENALQAAVLAGYKPDVQLLIDKGADVNAQSLYYGNVLQAARLMNNSGIVQLLREHGARETWPV